LHAKALFVVQQVMVLEGLLAAIRRSTPLEVVGATFRPEDAFKLVRSLQPDVVVLGLEEPESGIRLGVALRQDATGIGVVILAQTSDDLLHRHALESGCAAVITFESSVKELMVAVEAAAKGQTMLPIMTMERLASNAEQPRTDIKLTNREKEILALLAAGASTRSIADNLTLSTHTVRNHVKNLLAKLQVHTRLEAVVRAHTLGLI
jgi:DNA-binding NarL/FixJ family response regulator